MGSQVLKKKTPKEKWDEKIKRQKVEDRKRDEASKKRKLKAAKQAKLSQVDFSKGPTEIGRFMMGYLKKIGEPIQPKPEVAKPEAPIAEITASELQVLDEVGV
jgi:hypothetical protein